MLTLHCCSLLALAWAHALAAQVPYDQGSPGASGTTPRLAANQPFAGHAAFAYSVDRGRPTAPAALFLSASPAATSIAGARVAIDLAPVSFLFSVPLLLDASGSATLPGGLGGTPTALIGARIYLQAAVLEPVGSNPALATTNGLAIEVTEPPLVFLGTDMRSFPSEPFVFLDPRTGSVVLEGTAPPADGVTGAVFANGGRDLFVASRDRGTIERADLRGGSPVWSTFASLGTEVAGVALDRRRGRLFTMAGTPFGDSDLLVFDADPTSPSFGAELARRTAVARFGWSSHWDLAAAADRLAVHVSSSVGEELWILDTDPSGPSYLQTVDRTVIPELNRIANSLTGVRIRGDGRMAFALLGQRIAAGAGGVQRYDAIGRRWIDHNAALPGIQPIGPLSSPPGPIVSSRDFDVARDGSFGTLTDHDALVRIEFDREDPDAWRLVRLPAAWLPSANYRHAILGAGRSVMLVRSTQIPQEATVVIVDAQDGRILSTTVLPGGRLPSAFAQR